MTTNYAHDTTQTQYVAADGVQYAYRRFGVPGGTPIVFIQHFRGNMDNHDSAITNRLATRREVILFNNRGVASTDGIARETVDEMALDAGHFICALGLRRVDVIGHSMGGEVGQMLALQRPAMIRRLILVGTGPRGGEGMETPKPSTVELFTKVYERQDEMWLPIMFSPSPPSQAAGRLWLERTRARRDRDAQVSPETALAHWTAAQAWSHPNPDGFGYLKNIRCPTLIVNGSDDIVIATINSFFLQQNIPDARLVLYPDSNHGAHYQFHDDFVTQVELFLQEMEERDVP